jgi:hypothetical protein
LKKVIFFGVAAVVALVSIFSLDDKQQDVHAETDEMVLSDISLSEAELSGALDNIIGIDSYSVNSEAETVTIIYNPAIMQPEWIEKSFEWVSGTKNVDN